MSRIHYNNNSLEQLVEFSNLIVVATKRVPFVVTKKKSIGKGYRPFQLIQYAYKVDEILFGDTSFLNKKMLVRSAEWRTQYRNHKRYEIDKMRISPIYNRYLTTCDLEKEEQLILFLSLSEKNKISYRFISSYESLKKLSDVKAIIKNDKLKSNNEKF